MKKIKWTKDELQLYILLLCASADLVRTEAELDLIKSKFNEPTFDKIYQEFLEDTEERSFEKIQDNIALHHYSHREIENLRKEMQEVFFTDKKFGMLERNMERILRNMLY
ncbi:hypothetical protein C7S20_09050 [Christiangramia fulva]|uniref:TerB family tellurite resistance protein n=1 Tax=Christiangramia fulva TaxID=2126553 RepID=A0A2R3Z561_9FLAO|nr:hypothetical protein [Christiangramia fulva]AVR45405.1 hypothetical protein C7S20_09050 [Christiangramia fulva]